MPERSAFAAGVERMLLGPLFRLLVKPLDVGLELPPVDPPHAAAPDLDRGEIARSHQGVDLRDAHGQIGGHVLEREEAGLYRRPLGGVVLLRHRVKLSPDCVRFINLNAFAYVYARERATEA